MLRWMLITVTAAAGFAALAWPVWGGTRIENICTIQGQREERLVGLGLVIGLAGTGDGGGSLPTIRPLMAALKNLDNPVEKEALLKDARNVALVMVTATVPSRGIRRGQKLNCTVSSVGGAKSLKGGQLLLTPLRSGRVGDKQLLALASGEVRVHETPTSGTITQGATIESDFDDFIDSYIEDHSFTLLLDAEHATFHSAREVAHYVNQTLGGQYGGSLQNGPGQVVQLEEPIARAIGPGVVRVTIPEPERADPVGFVADVLAVRIETPHTEGRIVLNSRTGTVIVTGEVELSPVIVTHKNLVINVGDPAAAGGAGGGAAAAGTQAGGRFVPLMEKGPQATQQLRDLVDALNQLKVPPADIIDILKDLKASGKLHAVLVTE